MRKILSLLGLFSLTMTNIYAIEEPKTGENLLLDWRPADSASSMAIRREPVSDSIQYILEGETITLEARFPKADEESGRGHYKFQYKEPGADVFTGGIIFGQRNTNTDSVITDKYTFIKANQKLEHYPREYKFNCRLQYDNLKQYNENTQEYETIKFFTNEITFHVYSQPETYRIIQKDSITHVGLNREFRIELSDSTGNPKGWHVFWYINDKDTGEDSPSYIFNPEPVSEPTEFILTARIVNSAPDGETTWFEQTETFPITVYPSVSEIIQKISVEDEEIFIYPRGKEAYTYNGHNEEKKYSIDLSKLKKYGTWHYAWIFSYTPLDSESPERHASITDKDTTFIPDKSGKYGVEFSLWCVNPKKPEELWVEDTMRISGIDTLHVCDNPNNLQINQNPEENDTKDICIYFPHGNSTYTHLGKEAEQQYSVSINNASNYGVWVYKWKRNGEETADTDNASFKPEKRGDYITTLSIYCGNPLEKEITKENAWWYKEDIEMDPLHVYDDPNTLADSIHLNPEITKGISIHFPSGANAYTHLGIMPDELEYAVSIKDSVNFGRWLYHWERNGEIASDSTHANIQNSINPGTYATTLFIDCVSPANDEEHWLSLEVKDIDTLHIYEDPNTEGNRPHVVFPENKEAVYAIAQKEIGTYKIEEGKGGSDKWTYCWEEKDGTKHDGLEYIPDTQNECEKELIAHFSNVNPASNEEWLNDTTEGPYFIKIYPQIRKASLKPTGYTAVLAGEEVNLECEHDGGRGDGWEFHWQSNAKGNFTQPNKDKTTYTCPEQPEDGGTAVTIACQMTNRAPNNEVLFEDSAKIGLTVYPKPNCEFSDKTDKVMFQDTKFDIEQFVKYHGGYPDGWGIEVAIDGEKVNDWKTFKFENTGEHKLHISVKNEQEGSKDDSQNWYTSGEDFKVTIRPKPDCSTNFESEDAELGGSEDEYDIINDSTVTLLFKYSGGFDDDWSLEPTVLNTKGDTITGTVDVAQDKDNRYFRLVFTGKNDSDEGLEYTIKYTLKNEPQNLAGEPYVKSGSKKIVVWKEITATVDSLKFNDTKAAYIIETFEHEPSGEFLSLSISKHGGQDERWSYEWEYNTQPGTPAGTKIDEQKGSVYRIWRNYLKTDNEQKREYSYSVKAIYDGGKNNKTELKYDMIIVVWPKPKIENVVLHLKDKPQTGTQNVEYKARSDHKIELACYADDEMYLTFDQSGGINENGWEYKLDETPMDTIEYRAQKRVYEKKVTLEYTYDGEYYSDKRKWYSDEYTIKLDAIFDKPSINRDESYAKTPEKNLMEGTGQFIDVLEGDNIELNFPHKTPDSDNGWKYSWCVNNEEKSDYMDKWTYLARTDNPYEDQTLNVNISHSIGENYGLRETHEYKIRVWKKAILPSDFTLTDEENPRNTMRSGSLSIREGNTLRIKTDRNPQFGYNNDYTYEWKSGGSNVSVPMDSRDNWSVICRSTANQGIQGSRTLTYSLAITNPGPYGKVWGSMPEKKHEVTIYNRPKTPKSLVLKGNGSSHTLICTTDDTDTQLEGRDYYLVFGYGDDHDFTSIKQTKGQTRWSTQCNATQARQAYVYALWKYPNGVEVTSGKCYLKDLNKAADEKWDGSTYDQSTRAVIAELDPTGITPNSESTGGNTSVRVFSINGSLIGTTIQGLPSGLYIIERSNESGETTREKIIIK